MDLSSELQQLQQTVIRCTQCPRLVAHRREVARRKPKRYTDWDYWAKPLPSFGDPESEVLIIGLAPAAHGGNRTGRMFTGDRSGEWLFGALFQYGFANQPSSSRRDDGLALKNSYITATIRCAPPDNKPLPQEIQNCRPYFLRELDLLQEVKVFIALGQIAFTQTLRSLRMKGLELPPLSFGHGNVFSLPTGQTIITTYHPSQQNTQTGKLTKPMFHRIFELAKRSL